MSDLEELENTNLASVFSLRLSGNQFSSLKFVSHFPNLRDLDMSYNKIATIAARPHSSLRVINLDNNRLKSLEGCACFPNLLHLFIRSNKVLRFVSFEPLEDLKYLTGLDAVGNPASNLRGFQDFIAQKFPNLKTLDKKRLSDVLPQPLTN